MYKAISKITLKYLVAKEMTKKLEIHKEKEGS